jgi:peptidyl-prolyl cis-trans isomerase SurA|tara:strand:+ start:1512 stop:3434 length:1923 start_codon:yes stop_codon:yes gene_type:complete
MKKSILIIISILFTTNIFSQETLMTINDEKISINEFENIFYKNNEDIEITKEYLDEYIDLFINFKLKVKESKELGYDTLSSFVKELDGYKKQLSKPYLRDNNFNENLFNEALERIQFDINASHILIKIENNDAKSALNEALSIRNQIISKEISFADAAVKYSDDEYVLDSKGNLGYFTAFMMLYDFESVAYNTSIGEVSVPVKTQYGYHLILVNDKRKAVGERKVAHIMFKTGKGANTKKINESYKKASETYDLLTKGDKFVEVAERFSEDRSTAVKGGVLPSFGVGKMVREFEEATFSLKLPGDFSKPFQTPYGWHIVMLLEDNPVKLDDDLFLSVKQKIEKDSRSKLSNEFMITKLKDLYNIKIYKENFNFLRKIAVKEVSKSAWDNELLIDGDKKIFKIESKSYSLKELSDFIINNQKKNNDFDQLYIEFLNLSLLSYEESQLENKYPEFKNLLKEYKEGILLFDITNNNVWKKAVEDSAGLSNYFNENLSDYKWNERLDVSIFTCLNYNVSYKVRNQLYKLKRGLIKDIDVLNKINSSSPLNVQLVSGQFSKNENNIVDQIVWKKGISKSVKNDDGSYTVVFVHDILNARAKNLNETKGKVISDYQKFLDLTWIKILRAKYKVDLNKNLLYSLISK